MAKKSGFKVRWGNFDRLARKALDRMHRTDEVLDALGELVRSRSLRNFQLEQAPDGTKWKKSLRAMGSEGGNAGVKRDSRGRFIKGSGKKSKGKSGGKTLQDTAMLRNSITYKKAGHDLAVYIGTNLPYAAIHQFGGEIRPKARAHLAVPMPDGSLRLVDKVTIPARPYIGLNREIIEEANQIIEDFIKENFSL